jgi:hypothetical protein
MPHATPVVMDSEKSKLAAHAIKKRFEELNVPIKLNHAYEALAIAHRHPNWATMKASLSNTMHALKSDSQYKIGSRRPSAAEDEWEPFFITTATALEHFHSFSTSDRARHDFLEKVSADAVRRGGSLVFIEPVASVSMKSEILNRILSLAISHGRLRELFVLDLSDRASRVGNRCNLLADIQDPAICADLLLSDHFRPRSAGEYAEWHRVVVTCAERVMKGGGKLTIESVSSELDRFHSDGIPSEWFEGKDHSSYRTRISSVAHGLSRHLDTFASRNRRFLDQDSVWSGIGSAYRQPQIVVVFVSPEPSEMERLLTEIAYRAIQNGIKSKSWVGKGLPDMLLLNDVDFLVNAGRDFAQDATQSGVALAVADQCPSAPSHFRDRAMTFRSEQYQHDEKASFHYHIAEGKEFRIYLGG